MTQTPPKPNFQNTTKGRSSAAENRTPATNYSPSSYSPLSSQEQAATAAQAIKPLKSEAVERSAKAQGSLLQGQQFRWWRKLSLRFKAATLAVAIGTIPVLAIGGIAYYFADQSVTKQINETGKSSVTDLQDKVHLFMRHRFADIQVMARLDIFTDPKLRATTTIQDKTEALTRFQEASGIYNSIGLFDLKGDVIAQTPGKPLGNHLNRTYVREALKVNGPVLSQPAVSTSSGIFSVYAASVVKDQVTGQTIGFIRARIPVTVLEEAIKNYGGEGKQYFLINADGEVFIGPEGAYVTSTQSSGAEATAGKKTYQAVDAASIFPEIEQLRSLDQVAATLTRNARTNKKQLLAYAPPSQLQGLPDLNWRAVIATDTAVAFAPQRQLFLALATGTGITALLITAIAINLTERATRPILAAAGAAAKIGRGELDIRLEVQGEDELAQLGSNINDMATQLETFVQEQALSVEQASFLAEITSSRDPNRQDLEKVFNQALDRARKLLNAERVVVYRFNPDGRGYVSNESVEPGWSIALNEKIEAAWIPEELREAYTQGLVVPTSNVFNADFHPDHLQLMERLQIKANLVLPLLNQGQLFGLLIAHHCSGTHEWTENEIGFMKQLAGQLEVTLDLEQVEEARQKAEVLAEEQRRLTEGLQKRAMDLLMEVDPVSKGDLTIRASVKEDEIGTVADSYNSTIESLGKIVTQVQVAAKRVAETTNTSEVSVQSLSAEAVRQAEEISAALERIQAMNYSARTVVANAEQAEAAVKQAAQTVEAGDAAMNQTVDGILAIQGTVSETAKKVKRLGESSQNISQVVNLISRFAAQTHLLALKASIEAARAGEEGQGFAVIADEVRSLAAQSAQATAEIETLTASIQSETNEVAAAMEAGTEQVAVGTKLVEETRQSLNQIAEVSTTINQLVEAIAQAAVEQSQASQAVTQTMADVAAIAENTSTSSTNVSASFRELLAVAQELQESVSQFKVK